MTLEPQPEPPALRATDRDRDAAAALVQEAHADGRLDVVELDERLTQVYSSKTQLELRRTTADLVAGGHGTVANTLRIVAKHSSQRRQGTWRVPPEIDAAADHSSVRLDFVDAVVQVPDVHVDATVKHGSLVMIVPSGWHVDLDDVQLEHSATKNKAGAPLPGAPRLRVTGTARHSSIVVRHPRRKRWWWPWGGN